MTIASVGQKIIAFAYFAMIARFLGTELTGRYTTVLAFTTIVVVFVDLGLSTVLVREVARAKEKAQTYLSTVLATKIVLAILAYLGLIVLAYLFGYDSEYRLMLYISGMTMLFDSLHLSLYAVLRGYGVLKYEAVGVLMSQALTLILGGLALYFALPLVYLIAAFTISSAMNVLYVRRILKEKYHISIRPIFKKDIFYHIARIAVPFAFAAIFARVYSYIDGLMLKHMLGDSAAGIYAVPMKINFAFQFIPFALVASLYPRMSEYFTTNKERLATIFHQGIIYLGIIVLPIAVGIGLLARDIVLLIYTDTYIDSILPLQILMGGLFFFFMSFPIGACLNACNRQKTQTIIAGVVMLVNIGLNMVLIPIYGIVGAAVAAVAGNILLVLFGVYIVRQVVRISGLYLLKKFIQMGIAVVTMGVVVNMLSGSVSLLMSIVVGALVYLLMLFVTKAVEPRQIEEITALIRG